MAGCPRYGWARAAGQRPALPKERRRHCGAAATRHLRANASRSALNWSAWVMVRPCGAPGIDVLAQTKVVLQAGSSAITLEGGNITFSCPGEFKVKAGEHPFLGGAFNHAAIVALPRQLAPRLKYRGKLRVVDAQQRAQPSTYYKIVTADGEVLAQGVTDDSGRSITVGTESNDALTAYIGNGGWTIEISIDGQDEACDC
nr:DUF2345 domain-containing protein [Stenotrophomonas sp. ZAC14D1_NAIMI4_1]